MMPRADVNARAFLPITWLHFSGQGDAYAVKSTAWPSEQWEVQLKSDFHFDELVFAFAVIYIFAYDVATLSTVYEFDRIYRMEDFTADSAALVELVSAATGRDRDQSATYGSLVQAAPVNCHAGKARDTPQQAFGGWPETKRILFSALAKRYAVLSSPYHNIGYDLRPFIG